jgi:WD40 repeat protein
VSRCFYQLHILLFSVNRPCKARYGTLSYRFQIAYLKGHESGVNTAACSLDGTRIVTASDDTTARIWDAASGVQIACLEEVDITDASFSPDGALILMCSKTDPVRIWDVATGLERASLEGHDAEAIIAVVSPDGSRIVTGACDRETAFSGACERPLSSIAGQELMEKSSIRSTARPWGMKN